MNWNAHDYQTHTILPAPWRPLHQQCREAQIKTRINNSPWNTVVKSTYYLVKCVWTKL
jgi:hypothetical protein